MTRATEDGARVLSLTESLCPTCLARVPASVVRCGEDVYLSKGCGLHGEVRTVIWRGLPAYEEWIRSKVPLRPPPHFTEVAKGCPFDCGLCVEHRQQTCTALFEVTGRCDLGCRVCFALSGPRLPAEPSVRSLTEEYRRLMDSRGECNIQLSGGEPTLRDDLPALVEGARRVGFSFVQLNTNGIRLARSRNYAQTLKEAGLSSVFLQFDGTDDAIYRFLRGRSLLQEKEMAIEQCREAGLGVVLVPTVVPRINDENLGAIVRFALDRIPVVRGVHFQPVSYFGRYSASPCNEDRITLPEIMTTVERQTAGVFKAAAFGPPACEHALCSFHRHFVHMPDGSLIPIGAPHEGPECEEPLDAEEGSKRSVAAVARQWSGSPAAAAPACCCTKLSHERPSGQDELDRFLDRARTHTFALSGMAFQDAWTLDLERLRSCCIHVARPGGRLIPFCAFNLTSSCGVSLYPREA
ncbi:MAG: radical SAM (seleno)protein TrsS [bacterium]